MWPPAFFRPPESSPSADPVAELIKVALADEEWMGSLKEAIVKTIRQAYKDAVTEIVKEQIKTSAHYEEIQAECIEQLRRWPALKTDPEMQLRVSKTILGSFIR
jgi:hypothetical protein